MTKLGTNFKKKGRISKTRDEFQKLGTNFKNQGRISKTRDDFQKLGTISKNQGRISKTREEFQKLGTNFENQGRISKTRDEFQKLGTKEFIPVQKTEPLEDQSPADLFDEYSQVKIIDSRNSKNGTHLRSFEINLSLRSSFEFLLISN